MSSPSFSSLTRFGLKRRCHDAGAEAAAHFDDAGRLEVADKRVGDFGVDSLEEAVVIVVFGRIAGGLREGPFRPVLRREISRPLHLVAKIQIEANRN